MSTAPGRVSAGRPSSIVFAAGLALGALLGAPVAAGVTGSHVVPAATISTRSISCAGRSFTPIASSTDYGYSGVLRTGGLGNSDSWFACNPGLPSGAVVKKVQFTVRDEEDDGQISGCSLIRQGLSASNTSYSVMASVPSTGIDDTPGNRRLTTTDIVDARVDNTQFAYFLQCRVYWDTATAGLFGANVIYTISSAAG